GLGLGVTYWAGILTTGGDAILGEEYGVGSGGAFANGEVLGAGTYFFAVEAFAPRREFFDIAYDAYGLVREAETINPVPLPASAPLALGGLLMLGLIRRRRSV
nr:hypothetical protein [Paracoccaceae bacterium]